MPDGRRIAVKRLDKASGQGLKELRNELLLVAKLRHNNLAKLLGVCVKGQEKLLVYEYMPNRSLDTYLFSTQAILPSTRVQRTEIAPRSLPGAAAGASLNFPALEFDLRHDRRPEPDRRRWERQKQRERDGSGGQLLGPAEALRAARGRGVPTLASRRRRPLIRAPRRVDRLPVAPWEPRVARAATA